MFLLSSDKCPAGELLDPTAALFLTLEVPLHCFPYWLHQPAVPPAVPEGSIFSTASPALTYRCTDDSAGVEERSNAERLGPAAGGRGRSSYKQPLLQLHGLDREVQDTHLPWQRQVDLRTSPQTRAAAPRAHRRRLPPLTRTNQGAPTGVCAQLAGPRRLAGPEESLL